jgi:glycosyltransferase involved in cell wall biosynthesis
MRICIIGKFPPIQGGVSAQTYWSAHALARRGHDVHVVTNAKEAVAPYRMHMRAEDWDRCEAVYAGGSVSVQWTDPIDQSQAHIPLNSPVVTKLATLAAHAHAARPFDVIFSHYLEPYGVAGHLAAQMTGVPHVVRMAGSDAGRLWQHPQFELLYDHVLRSAEVVIAAGAVVKRAVERGIAADRIAPAGGFAIPEHLFAPEGPLLDITALRATARTDPQLGDPVWGGFMEGRPCIGVYGKLGERKGSFALLAAMQRLMEAGLDVSLVALAHGRPTVQSRFRTHAAALGLADRVLQIPFLPHWRVPEFLRSCLAVCCLEQGFPIEFHAPMTPREVLLSGTCLVASTELIRKLRSYERLPHGYGCMAIEDVNDIDALSEALAAIVRDPKAARAIGRRGRQFALELQRDITFPQTLERTLAAAAARQKISHPTPGLAVSVATHAGANRFPLTQLVAAAIGVSFGSGGENDAPIPVGPASDVVAAERVLDAVERSIADGRTAIGPLAAVVRTEIAVAAAEDEGNNTTDLAVSDPLFRLGSRTWALPEDGVAALAPVRNPRLRILKFDHEVRDFLGAELPTMTRLGPSYIVAYGRCGDKRREPLIVDGLTAHILTLSDGRRSAAEIARELDRESNCSTGPTSLEWIEHLFVCGLIWLCDKPTETGTENLVE